MISEVDYIFIHLKYGVQAREWIVMANNVYSDSNSTLLDASFYFVPQEGCEAFWWAYPYVCMYVRLSACISQKSHVLTPHVQTSQIFSMCYLSFPLGPPLAQGDHFSGKPGNVREFCSCQGNVSELAFCHGIVMELSGKNLVRENCYNVCMASVAESDCDMINAETFTV